MKPAIVVDASAMIDALVDGTGRGDAVRRVLPGFDSWVAPHHLDLECLNSWRSMVRRGALPRWRMSQALRDLANLPFDRVPTVAFHDRIEELSENVTPYDAAYVVLAEAFDLALLTTDARLARASGPRCEFILV